MNRRAIFPTATHAATRCALLLVPALLSGSLNAQVLSFDASAQVIPRCRVETGGDIAFGELDPGRARDSTAATTIRVACTRGTGYRLTVDQGAAFDATRATRTMRRSTGERLPYALTASGEFGIATGWQRPIDVRLQATVKAADYVNLPGGTYEDIVKIVIEY